VNTLWEQAANARVIDLANPIEAGMPVSPNHPGFKMALQRRHGDMVRADGGSAANEMIMIGGHTGTHVDALCHVSHQGKLHGGVDALGAQQGGRFRSLGVETCSMWPPCAAFPASKREPRSPRTIWRKRKSAPAFVSVRGTRR
jgi:hypothetical protein